MVDVCHVFCRTNPKANVRLSGKKRRRLARDARRLLKENTEMEGVCYAGHPYTK